jgi:hypothetical protein
MAHRIGNIDYEVVGTRDGKFGVKIFTPTGLPQLIEGFADQTEAENWIFAQEIAPGEAVGKYGPFEATD